MTVAAQDHLKKVLEMVDTFSREVSDLEKFDYFDNLAAALEDRMTSILEAQDELE